MRIRYFVGIPHHKVHYKFYHSLLGGEFIYYPSGIYEEKFTEEVLKHDDKDVIWFFSDIYFNLHPLLKGKQILTKHGLSFGDYMNSQRAESFNMYFDFMFQTGFTQEKDHRKFRIIPEKIKPVGYTILFEIPDIPSRDNAVLFSSTCFRPWHHYGNLIKILWNLDPAIDGYLSVHPQTRQDRKKALTDISIDKKNLTLIRSQEELLEAYAFCSYNVSGGTSSLCAPFWYQQKPVIFLRGRSGFNYLKGIGWKGIKRRIGEPLFSEILDESAKISRLQDFSWELIRNARPSPSALKVFYPWNFDQRETENRVIEYIEELKNS